MTNELTNRQNNAVKLYGEHPKEVYLWILSRPLNPNQITSKITIPDFVRDAICREWASGAYRSPMDLAAIMRIKGTTPYAILARAGLWKQGKKQDKKLQLKRRESYAIALTSVPVVGGSATITSASPEALAYDKAASKLEASMDAYRREVLVVGIVAIVTFAALLICLR